MTIDSVLRKQGFLDWPDHFLYRYVCGAQTAVRQELKSFCHDAVQAKVPLSDLIASAKRAHLAFQKALKAEEKEAVKKKAAIPVIETPRPELQS